MEKDVLRHSEFDFDKRVVLKRTETLLGEAIDFHCWTKMWWNDKGLCPHSPAGRVMGARVSQADHTGRKLLFAMVHHSIYPLHTVSVSLSNVWFIVGFNRDADHYQLQFGKES